MTATGRGKPADPLGRFNTPIGVAMQCVNRVLPLVMSEAPLTVLEPSAGSGNFVWAIKYAYPGAAVSAIDIEPHCHLDYPPITIEIERQDFLADDFSPTVNLVIGNPPFRHAEAFCRKALQLAPNVVFLLRLGFLASQKRFGFWSAYPPKHVAVLARRPSFTGGGTDSSDYCFVCWSRGKHETRLHWLPPYKDWDD